MTVEAKQAAEHEQTAVQNGETDMPPESAQMLGPMQTGVAVNNLASFSSSAPLGQPAIRAATQTVQPIAAATESKDGERWPTIVRSLRNTDFRHFWAGNFLSNIGTWMQNIAQGWLVLQLTNSPFWLGFVGFIGSLPMLLFTLFGGVVADRVNKRTLLMWTQTAMMLQAFAMAILAYFKIITVAEVAALSFINGIAQAMNTPSYQALVPQLVRRSDLTNAIALNSAQFNMSRVIGPTLGGYAMAAFGVAGNFFLNGFSFLAVLFAISRIDYPEPERVKPQSVWSSLREGFQYVRSKRQLLDLVVLISGASLLLIPFITFIPYFAKNVLNTGERGLGLLMAYSGAGAFLAAITIAYVGQMRHRGRLMVFSGLVVMAGVIVFCYTHNFAIAAALMVLEGFGMIFMASTMNVCIQQLASDEMRGRVMSIHATAFMGLPPLGCLIAGELSRHMPTSHAIAAMVAVAMLCFITLYIQSKPLRTFD